MNIEKLEKKFQERERTTRKAIKDFYKILDKLANIVSSDVHIVSKPNNRSFKVSWAENGSFVKRNDTNSLIKIIIKDNNAMLASVLDSYIYESLTEKDIDFISICDLKNMLLDVTTKLKNITNNSINDTARFLEKMAN